MRWQTYHVGLGVIGKAWFDLRAKLGKGFFQHGQDGWFSTFGAWHGFFSSARHSLVGQLWSLTIETYAVSGAQNPLQRAPRPVERLRSVTGAFLLFSQLTYLGDLWRGP